MRARRTETEWAGILAEFEASGEKGPAFCARRRINVATFNWWRWTLRARPKTRRVSRSVELVPVEIVPVAPPESPLFVALDGVEIRITTDTDVRYVAALVGALRGRC